MIFTYINTFEYQYVGDAEAPSKRVNNSKQRTKTGTVCEHEPEHTTVSFLIFLISGPFLKYSRKKNLNEFYIEDGEDETTSKQPIRKQKKQRQQEGRRSDIKEQNAKTGDNKSGMTTVLQSLKIYRCIIKRGDIREAEQTVTY